MKVTATTKFDFKFKEAGDKVDKAKKTALLDTVVAIANDAIKDSPILTGNNRRSIRYEVGPNGEVAKNEGEGAVYSTSGYGGFLETGTVKMAARPYMKPALDRNIHILLDTMKRDLK